MAQLINIDPQIASAANNDRDKLVNRGHDNPTFAEIYTHLEGRVFNGGIKIRL